MYRKDPTCAAAPRLCRVRLAVGASLYTSIGSAMIWPTVMRGLSELYGSGDHLDLAPV